MKLLNINPVLAKEVKVKMRSWRIVAMLSAYLGVLALVAIFIVIAMLQNYSVQPSSSVTTGAYTTIAIIQFLLLVFIAPALTSGTISGERERQTLDLLLCTRMTPLSIILGKLIAALSQVVLLIVASLPIFSVVFLFGGISVANVIQLILFYLVVALLMGSIGIFASTFIKKTTASNVATYGIALFLLFGVAFIGLFYTLLAYKTNNSGAMTAKNFFLSYINPLSGFISLMSDQLGVSSAGNFMIPGVYIPGIRTTVVNAVNLPQNIPFWVTNVLLDLVMSFLFLAASVAKLNPIKKKMKETTEVENNI